MGGGGDNEAKKVNQIARVLSGKLRGGAALWPERSGELFRA